LAFIKSPLGDAMRKFLVYLAAAVMGLALTSAARADTVRLVTLEFPPYQYGVNGGADGIVVRILTEAFTELGKDLTIEVLPWKRALYSVQTGEADAIFTAYKTAERETFLDYSNTVLMPQVVSVWVKKDSDVAYDGTLESLATAKIGLVDGISYGTKVDDAIKNGVLTDLDYAPESANNIRKLLGGRIDAVIMNKYGAMHHVSQLANLEEVEELQPEISSVPSFIAFSKANNLAGLRDELDGVLQKMIENGDYQATIDAYFTGG